MRSYKQFAYVYDELMEDMPYSEWLGFARLGWEKFGKPRTVVDLGCGTGTLAIPLVQEGFHVTGIDLSADMLSVARRKLELFPVGSRWMREGNIRWIQQDMRDWELPEPADSVISFCDCLNYLLDESDVARTFERTLQGLKPGGSFMFDVHHPRQFERYETEQPFIYDEDNISYIWTCDLDAERHEIEHRLTIFARAEETAKSEELFYRFEETHIQRAYEPQWLLAQLHEAGFSEVHIFGDFIWEPPTEETSRLFFVAIK